MFASVFRPFPNRATQTLQHDGRASEWLLRLEAGVESARQNEYERLTGLIKQSWLESGGVYGYRKITHDLRDPGERCGKHRIYRLMLQEGLRAQISACGHALGSREFMAGTRRTLSRALPATC